jgi:hypothetical protein
MTKYILLIAAVIGFIAQSGVDAADPTPAPSASPGKAHYGKHHKKATEPKASPTPKAGY